MHILYGYGEACDRAAAAVTSLHSAGQDARAGSSLAAADLDGDGLLELAVGAQGFRRYILTADPAPQNGAVFVLLGKDISELGDGVVPLDEDALGDPRAVPFSLGESAARLVEGREHGASFGATLAMTGSGGGWLFVGAPAAAVYGLSYDAELGAFLRAPALLLTGEGDCAGAGLGTALSLSDADPPRLVVGSPRGSALAVQAGAGYVVDIAP